MENLPLPPELRRQLLEDIENGKAGGDPFADMEDIDTMVPQGGFQESATPLHGAPEGAVGSLQHLISKQVESLKGTEMRGVYFRDEDPANPEKVIKSGGDRKIIPVMQEPKVVFCDLATEEGRKEYERVMELLASSLGTYQLFEPEAPPHIEVDRAGVPHAIVILKYCKMSKVVAVKQEKYTEVSEESMKEKFFPNHSPVVVQPGSGIQDDWGDVDQDEEESGEPS
jgi:hypothetical protein